MKKYLQIIFWIIFFLFLTLIFWKEYIDFHLKKNIDKNNISYINQKLKNFSKNKIKLIKNINIFSSKENFLKQKIIKKINSAKNKIFIEIYLLTDQEIKNAIIKAKKRWVKIKIILEKNIYKSRNLNLKNFLEFKKNKIDIVWSNPKNYKLNHSKLLIIDNLLILSTWNLTKTTFTKNKDFFIFCYDKKIKSKFEKIFLNDFLWKKINIYDENIILSPNYSKQKFDKLFSQTKKSIKMYIPYLWDNFELKLIKKAKQNINLQIIFWDYKSNDKKIEKIKKFNIKIKKLKKIK